MFSTAKYKPDGGEDSGSLTKEAVVDPCFYYSRCLKTLLPSRQSLSLSPLKPLVPVYYDTPHLSFSVDPWAWGTSVFS